MTNAHIRIGSNKIIIKYYGKVQLSIKTGANNFFVTSLVIHKRCDFYDANGLLGYLYATNIPGYLPPLLKVRQLNVQKRDRALHDVERLLAYTPQEFLQLLLVSFPICSCYDFYYKDRAMQISIAICLCYFGIRSEFYVIVNRWP